MAGGATQVLMAGFVLAIPSPSHYTRTPFLRSAAWERRDTGGRKEPWELGHVPGGERWTTSHLDGEGLAGMGLEGEGRLGQAGNFHPPGIN